MSNGKIHMFNGKIHMFNGKIHIFRGKIHIFHGKIHYNGHPLALVPHQDGICTKDPLRFQRAASLIRQGETWLRGRPGATGG